MSPPKTPSFAGNRGKNKCRGPKTSQKQVLPVQERLKKLFTSLCAQIDGNHYTNAIKTCDKILRLEPHDADALQTKLFLLLQTEQYNDALNLVGNDKDKSQHAFEQAYSLYRLNNEAEARAVLKAIQDEKGETSDRGVVHLEAQLNYRDGAYGAAVELYDQLLDTAEPHSEEHSDILTNLQASQKHLDFINMDFLRALDALPATIINTIETAPPPAQHQSSSAAPAAATSVMLADKLAVAQSIKKVRKSRVPAGVIPGVTPSPDPERWLKKSERSTFGQGRRRKGPGGGGGGATQGSASVDMASASATQPVKSSSKGKKKK